MVFVPAGPFIYGPEEIEQKISLPAFFMDMFEVTNEEYAKARPHQYPEHEPTHPVVNVSWNDARRYCEAVGKRLPTEQEWEKAARGTDGRRYPWGDTFDPAKANTGHRFSGTTPVDKFPEGRSPYGTYDMAGNVWEWTSSDQDAGKVIRGGLWFDTVIGVKATYRNSFPPSTQLEYLGFRCAKDAPH
jgi:formylglycine-generating enzyme required for sulfatase activity